MSKCTYIFNISFNSQLPLAHSTGVSLQTPSEVESIANESGFDLTSNFNYKDGTPCRAIKIVEPEDSNRLQVLLKILQKKYGITPKESIYIPKRKMVSPWRSAHNTADSLP